MHRYMHWRLMRGKYPSESCSFLTVSVCRTSQPIVRKERAHQLGPMKSCARWDLCLTGRHQSRIL